MICPTSAEEFDTKCTTPTVKHGGGSVVYWGCFSPSEVGNLVFIDENMTGTMYRDILDHKLLQSAKKLKLGKILFFNMTMILNTQQLW